MPRVVRFLHSSKARIGISEAMSTALYLYPHLDFGRAIKWSHGGCHDSYVTETSHFLEKNGQSEAAKKMVRVLSGLGDIHLINPLPHFWSMPPDELETVRTILWYTYTTPYTRGTMRDRGSKPDPQIQYILDKRESKVIAAATDWSGSVVTYHGHLLDPYRDPYDVSNGPHTITSEDIVNARLQRIIDAVSPASQPNPGAKHVDTLIIGSRCYPDLYNAILHRIPTIRTIIASHEAALYDGESDSDGSPKDVRPRVQVGDREVIICPFLLDALDAMR